MTGADLDSNAAQLPRLVSIVLTTLNGARYLRESIDSCLSQTYPNIELIVVDGGSTDGTLDILASYTDPRMRVIHQKDNEGKLPGAINLGLAEAKGEYLTWHQDDSFYTPDAIEKMVSCLGENPGAGQAYADFWEIDSSGTRKKIVHLPEPADFLAAWGDPGGVCFLIRHSVRVSVGIHDIATHPNHDYDYRLRIALQFPSVHIHEALYSWRLHTNSLTGQLGWVTLARNDVPIRSKLGLIKGNQGKRRLAEIDIAESFHFYQSEHYSQVPRLVWSGLVRNPGYAWNKGVLSILVKSLARGFTRASTHAES